MLKVMSRYKKRIMAILSVLVLVIGCICSVSFESSAANNDVTFAIPGGRPEVTTNSGYVELLCDLNDGGGIRVICYSWNIQPLNLVNGSEWNSMDVDITNSSFTLTALAEAEFQNTFTILYTASDGRNGVQHSVTFDTIYTYYFPFPSGTVIYSYKIYGNYGNVTTSFHPTINYSVIYDSERVIVDEQKETNSWLENIWNSIQEFFKGNDEDKETTDKFKEDSNKQSSELNELNKQNQSEKVDAGSASGSVDGNVDTGAMQNYGTLLQIFTNHDYVLRSLLLVVSICLVAYVLFGKKK